MSESREKSDFFRHSGWLMMANIAGGLLNYGMHFLQKGVPGSPAYRENEYGIFGVFLSVAMVIPTMSLQMVMAHQTALALATNRERELRRLIRRLTLGAFALWAIAALIVFTFQARILARWGINNPAGLWITMAAVLFSIWMPMFWGVLQGQQNFFPLGWSMILNGAGRLLLGLAMVLALAHFAASSLGSYAAGMMVGVATGMAVASGLAVWHSRSLWHGPSAPFAWRVLAAEALPPLLGLAAFQFLFTADQMFVKVYFPDDAGRYFSAGTMSRALIWLVGPLASVMFPRLVHSAAKAEKTNLMTVVLAGTAILAVLGSVGLIIVGPWIVPLIYQKDYVPVVKAVLPWYAAAMVPLAVANVLLSNLLAKSAFRIVIPLCLLAAAYGWALTHFHESMVMMLQTLGVANLILLLICAAFTWAGKSKTPTSESQAANR
jgi:O-antigen/teichoic acid export membrane protein